MCPPDQNLEQRYSSVLDRIREASTRAGREGDSIRLLAVSKTKPAEQVAALAALGQRDFGENYVDEAVAKIDALKALDLNWHFIGPIQSNKTRLIALHFDWVESVDRAKIIRRLADHRPDALAPLNVLLQVNLDAEDQKAGCEPAELSDLAEQVASSDRLCLRGLMTIPAPRERIEDQRAVFSRLRTCFETLAERFPTMDTISAGMSGDLEAAIAEGSTEIRVGTDLFGARR